MEPPNSYPQETLHLSMINYLQVKIAVAELKNLSYNLTIERKIKTQEINDKLKDLFDFISASSLLRKEVQHFPSAISCCINADLTWCERLAERYFLKMFSDKGYKINEVLFLPKTAGDQIGKQIRLTYEPEKSITYHIKTHQHGSRRQGSSNTPVDPKELFFYKVLENSGYGPKVDFFFNPLTIGGFYIATQDEGYSKVLGKQKYFNTYGKASEQLKIMSSNNETKIGFIMVELLMKIFILWDVIGNSGNFGIVYTNNRQKWRIIDFRVHTESQYPIIDILHDLKNKELAANSDELLSEIIQSMSINEIMHIASLLNQEFNMGRPHFSKQGRKLPLKMAIRKSYCEIIHYFKQTTKEYNLGIDLQQSLGTFSFLKDTEEISNEVILKQFEKLELSNPEYLTQLGDLGRYVKTVELNLDNFITGIQAYNNFQI